MEKINWRTFCIAVASIAVVWSSLLLLTPVKAEAVSPTVGGCKEAYVAPHSAAADECREQGWTIRVRPSGHGIIVSPKRIVRYVWLPQCRNEDGSGQRSACTWNVTLPYQGNGLGRALWIDWSDRIHYVKRTLAPQEMRVV